MSTIGNPFSHVTLDSLRLSIGTFAQEREWDQFHQPRNLLLALVGEVGEIAEIFQWKGECSVGLAGWSDRDREHLGEELSDVLLYLVRLADRCGIDLAAAAERKMGLNRKKYPVELSRGSSAKYTAYEAAVAVAVATSSESETGEKTSEVPKSTATAAEGSPTNPYRNSATGEEEEPSLHRHLHFTEDPAQQQQQQQQPLATLGLIASGAICGALVMMIAWRRSTV